MSDENEIRIPENAPNLPSSEKPPKVRPALQYTVVKKKNPAMSCLVAFLVVLGVLVLGVVVLGALVFASCNLML